MTTDPASSAVPRVPTTHPTPVIRRATIADVGRCPALQADFYEQDGCFHRDEPARISWERLLADAAAGVAWVAERDADIVGYVPAAFVHSLEHFGRDAMICELYVATGWRGRSVRSRLLDTTETACREAHVSVLRLEVEPDKERVAAMHRRHGFVDKRRLSMARELRGARTIRTDAGRNFTLDTTPAAPGRSHDVT